MSAIKFEQTYKKAIDIVDAWTSTNTEWEVIIIRNVKDMYELWLENDENGFRDNDFMGMYDTFDIAVRNAECMVDVYEPAWGNSDDWTPRARGWCE